MFNKIFSLHEKIRSIIDLLFFIAESYIRESLLSFHYHVMIISQKFSREVARKTFESIFLIPLTVSLPQKELKQIIKTKVKIKKKNK